jgi:hypothetical protein
MTRSESRRVTWRNSTAGASIVAGMVFMGWMSGDNRGRLAGFGVLAAAVAMLLWWLLHGSRVDVSTTMPIPGGAPQARTAKPETVEGIDVRADADAVVEIALRKKP